jgi:DNA polymerase-4
MSAYTKASRAVFEVFERTTPLVEALSIDEAFLDVAGLWRISGTPQQVAATVREQVRDQVGLPITVGVATTKFLAKVASAVAKPDGLLVVPAGKELTFLHPLPVERLWGVGTVTSAKLRAQRITTVADVAALTERELVTLLGQAAGRHLHALANGLDPRPVEHRRRRRSIGSQRALGRRERTADELDAILAGLVDRVTRRMRRAHRVCRTVVLRLRFADFSRGTRSRTMVEPTAESGPILAAARGLLGSAHGLIASRGITLLGISLSNLVDDNPLQLPLPFDERPRDALDFALDDVRDRFGSNSITRAALLGKDSGIEMPLLPD